MFPGSLGHDTLKATSHLVLPIDRDGIMHDFYGINAQVNNLSAFDLCQQ